MKKLALFNPLYPDPLFWFRSDFQGLIGEGPTDGGIEREYYNISARVRQL